jgi:hypothetical protein
MFQNFGLKLVLLRRNEAEDFMKKGKYLVLPCFVVQIALYNFVVFLPSLIQHFANSETKKIVVIYNYFKLDTPKTLLSCMSKVLVLQRNLQFSIETFFQQLGCIKVLQATSL